MTGKLFSLEIQPRIPSQLARLEELANDLLYSWDRSVRSLFHRLDDGLWQTSGHSPKVPGVYGGLQSRIIGLRHI